MSPVNDAYPVDCAFCNISKAYPPTPHSLVPFAPDPEKVSPQCHLILSTSHVLAFLDIMPMAPAHILLTTRTHYRTLADLPPPQLPHSADAPALGKWLPVLSRAVCRATAIEDWNVVQNNGARAAQVVPHVHFHLIPRYQEGRRETQGGGGGGSGKKTSSNKSATLDESAALRSWKMFGRGAREDLDDDEGRELAAVLRNALRLELGEAARPEAGGRSRL